MTANARTLLWLLLLLICIGVCLWLQPRPIFKSSNAATKPARPRGDSSAPPSSPLPGEQILQSYAEPSSRPENDLSMLAHALSNLTLLIKGPDPIRLGANEEIAAALLGKNRAQLAFLPKTHRAFNAQGQIVDRWQSPLFFHAVSQDRVDIRSAGPDRKLWTADDLHRRHDGQFLSGPDLNAPSLFDEDSAISGATR